MKKISFTPRTFIGISLCIAVAGFAFWKLSPKAESPKYVVQTVERGTITTSTSGSGSVSPSHQIDIKPKVSGKVLSVHVKNGQEISENTLLIRLDTSDAIKTVRDAERAYTQASATNEKSKKDLLLSVQSAENAVRDAQLSLDNARLALEKLKKPSDDLSLLQAQNSLDQATATRQQSLDTQNKAYEDGFNAVASTYTDIPSIMSGLNDIFYTQTLDASHGSDNVDWYANQVSSYDSVDQERAYRYKNDFYTSYQKARSAYTTNFDHYKSASRTADSAATETLISETNDTTTAIADAVRAGKNYIDFVQDAMKQHNRTIPSGVITHQASLNSYTNTTSSHLQSLLSIKNSFQNTKDGLAAADRSIQERTQSLQKLKNGADPLDIQSQESTIRGRENALVDAQHALIRERDRLNASSPDQQLQAIALQQKIDALADAREKLNDYLITAPLSGVIASLPIKPGDEVGPSTILATIATKQKIAEMSLNEIDVAKIKPGQKTTLAFDAIPNLALTGTVAEMDSIGTESQGVVTYTIKIAFDTQDDRIRPSMSVSISIITDIKQDVLLVPNSAVKKNGAQARIDVVDVAALPSGATSSTFPISLEKAPISRTIETGISNDTSTEIVSGISAGDIIVTRIVQSSTGKTTTTPPQSSLFSVPGAGGNRGGMGAGGAGGVRRGN